MAEGNKVILSFNISGAKPSVIPDQVIWSFTNLAGQRYDININERYNFSIDKSKLILMDTHRTDRGNYSIIINHNTGQYNSSIELFIKGKTLNLILLSLFVNEVVQSLYKMIFDLFLLITLCFSSVS